MFERKLSTTLAAVAFFLSLSFAVPNADAANEGPCDRELLPRRHSKIVKLSKVWHLAVPELFFPDPRLVVVAGPTASGKTFPVRNGVLPALNLEGVTARFADTQDHADMVKMSDRLSYDLNLFSSDNLDEIATWVPGKGAMVLVFDNVRSEISEHSTLQSWLSPWENPHFVISAACARLKIGLSTIVLLDGRDYLLAPRFLARLNSALRRKDCRPDPKNGGSGKLDKRIHFVSTLEEAPRK